MSAPTLNIRCPSWSHVENFYTRKVKAGNVLLARVPFTPVTGSAITIALEFPDGLKVLIPAEIEAVKQAPDGRKSAVRMVLQGLDGAMRARLERAVSEGLATAGDALPLRHRSSGVTRTEDGLPLAIPADVPIDELVPVVGLPKSEDVPEASREQYIVLEESLTTLREKAAHDVLGVEWDADVATVRLAYFKLVKKYHPDVMARHNSPEISFLSSELFIYINKAYDRLRDSAVEAGKAIAAGPALLPHNGWLADFDDLDPVGEEALLKPIRWQEPGERGNTAESVAGKPAPELSERAQAASERQGDKVVKTPNALQDKALFNDARITHSNSSPIGEQLVEPVVPEVKAEINADVLIQESKEMIDGKNYDKAREHLANLLEENPRNRTARALYHVAYGYTLLARKKGAEAQTQFEVALKHDPGCKHAKAAVPGGRRRRPSLLERILRR